MSDLGPPKGRRRPMPERLPQREPVRTTGRRWLLGCGIHTGKRARARCPVCDQAHAETLEALDGDAMRRYHAERARQTRAQQVREERHGTQAGGEPAVTRYNMSKARHYARERERGAT